MKGAVSDTKNIYIIMFRGRLMRRTIARYLIVALIQCLRMTSIQVGVQWEVHIDKIFTKKNNLTQCT